MDNPLLNNRHRKINKNKDANHLGYRKLSIDYVKIVDDYNQQSFLFCREKLFPLFRYKVLKEEDVRKVDLQEKLLELESNVVKKSNPAKGSLNLYMDWIRSKFDRSFRFVEGSRAYKYKERVLELMGCAQKEGSLEDVDDIFIVFTSFLRAQKDDPEGTRVLGEFPGLDIKIDDVGIFDTLREEAYNKYSSRERNITKAISDHSEGYSLNDLLYVNNILFLSRWLQSQGVFSMEVL